jgi:hypothetical protein
MDEEDDVLAFINQVSSLVDELGTAGVAISNTDVVLKLLIGLPRSWAPPVMAMESVDPSVLTKDYVVGRLMLERDSRPVSTTQRTWRRRRHCMPLGAVPMIVAQHRCGSSSSSAGRDSSAASVSDFFSLFKSLFIHISRISYA